MDKKAPDIAKRLVDFFNYWKNPTSSKEKYIPYNLAYLEMLMVSPFFVFKWVVTKKELMQLSKYMDIEIVNNTIEVSMEDEYFIEITSIKS